MTMDWPRILTLVAHELRSPTSVITGYSRLIRDGRLDNEGQAQAIKQIESAASVAATLGRQASDLSRWISPHPEAGMSATIVPLPALLSGAVHRIETKSAIDLDIHEGLTSRVVQTLDRDSLSIALSAVLASVCREALGEPVRVTAAAVNEDACEILASPASSGDHPGDVTTGDDLSYQFAGGAGLSVVLGVAVISAHGGKVMSLADHPNIVKVTLRVARREPT